MIEVRQQGYVYVLYNPIYDRYGEIYKIGQAKNIKDRLNSYSTYYPEESEIKYSILHPYYKDLEKLIHLSLKEYRININREFFKCSLDLIKETIDYLKDYTLEEISEVLNKKTSIILRKYDTIELNEPIDLTKDNILKIYSESTNELNNNFFLNNKYLGLRSIVKIFIEKLCTDKDGRLLISKYNNKYIYTNSDKELTEITSKAIIDLILDSFNFKNILSYNCSLSLSKEEISYDTYKERIKYIDKELKIAQKKFSKILSEYIH